MQAIVKGLSEIELSELRENELIIKKGLKTFSAVGNALLIIRDGKLYRESHKTFEDYCGERWGIKQSRAYQLMDSAKVTDNLKTSTIVELPATESQARPLAKLPADKQAEVWESVTEKAKREERKVTAKDVEMAVSAEINPEKEKQSKALGVGVRMANDAIAILQKIPISDKLRGIGLDTVTQWIKANK